MTTQDFKAPALHSGHGSYKPSSTHTRASEWEHSSTSVGRAVPLKQEKLEALHELVNEQLNKRHIVESFSPWNSPVFFVQKKSGKWRMLTDLRAVNAAIVPMGALQPGLPNPSMILSTWHLFVIDLKDCFFTIPLHPNDQPRFAFSVPSINLKEPHKRFQ